MSKRKFTGEHGPSVEISWRMPLLAAAAAFIAFLPALRAGFVWDDSAIILANPNLRALGWRELRWMFSTTLLGPYQPLSWLSYAFDWMLWGLRPAGYHFTNLLLHSANAALMTILSFKLLKAAGFADSSLPKAALVSGLLFAVHPLRVESVAWITERRDVLSGLFYLSATLFYLSSRLRWALASYLLALLAKGIGLGFPIVLYVLDKYPLNRKPPKAEKLPFWCAALAAAAIAHRGQTLSGAFDPYAGTGVWERLASAGYGLMFYLQKTLIPHGLLPLYPRPGHSEFFTWPFLLSAVAAIVLTAAFWACRRRWPAGLAAWVCYAVLLGPVLGLIPFGKQLVADRYSYLSCMVWPILAAGGLLALNNPRAWNLALAAAVGLGALSWRQTLVWRDDESLWSHAASLRPRESLFQDKLGHALMARGRAREALERFKNALEYDPENATAHLNFGLALSGQGRSEEALGHFRAAVRIRPAFPAARTMLGNALAARGRKNEAILEYRETLRHDRRYAPAHVSLGGLLASSGRLEEAVSHFREAVLIHPANWEAHFNLGKALTAQGKIAEARPHLDAAFRLRAAR